MVPHGHRRRALGSRGGALLNGAQLARLGEAEHGGLEVVLADDAPLRRVRAEEERAEHRLQVADLAAAVDCARTSG